MTVTMLTIDVTGPFDGPNFVSGLANQTSHYKLKSSTHAVIKFDGGMDASVKYKEIQKGTGFGIDAQGNFVGVGTHFKAIDMTNPNTFWVVTGFQTLLAILDTNVSSPNVTFPDVLVSPVAWHFNGDKFADNFAGGPFDDILEGNNGNDTLTGFGGDDLLKGGNGVDTLGGNQGADTLKGGDDSDTINGDIGSDTLLGQKGADIISGGAGGDDIFGGNGADNIAGDTGGDFIKGGNGNDLLDGGLQGDDLFGGSGNDTLIGDLGVDMLKGGAGNDELYGDDNTDQLFGNNGGDLLAGGAGSDFLNGGKGNDILSGNDEDNVDPDFSFDTYIFNGKFGDDIITDFEIAFDTIRFGSGIKEKNVSVSTVGNDVMIDVKYKGHQSILVEGVAADFDADAFILYP